MYHDVTEMRILDGYKLQLTFDDGTSAVIDFEEYLDKGTVFAPLKDLDFFKKAKINFLLKQLFNTNYEYLMR